MDRGRYEDRGGGGQEHHPIDPDDAGRGAAGGGQLRGVRTQAIKIFYDRTLLFSLDQLARARDPVAAGARRRDHLHVPGNKRLHMQAAVCL